VLIEKKSGKMMKRNVSKGRSMKTRPLLSNPELKYKYLCENGSALMLMIAADGKVIDANNGFLEMSGYSSHDIIGKNVLGFVVAEQRNKTAAEIQAALSNGGTTPQFEVTFRSKDDSTRTILLPQKQLVSEEEGQRSILVTGIDITERTHMEKALQDSEERYRALVEDSPNLIGIFQDGVLKYVNSATIHKLGWTYEELVSPSFNPIENLVSQKSRSLLKENVGKTLSGEDVAHLEMSLTRKDGSEIPVSVRGVRIIYNQKPAIEFIFDDITERKRAEEKLRESEERYRSLFQGMMEGFAYCKMIFDESGRPVDFVYIDVNSAFSPLTGLGDVVGKRVSEVIPGIKETNPELLEIYGRVASTGKPEKFEVDMKPLGISLNISVSSPAKGYFVAVFENITERKRAEEARQASEGRLRRLTENMLDMVVETDLLGVGKYASQSSKAILGYDPKDLVGKSLYDLVHPEDLGTVTENIQRAISTGRLWRGGRFECRYRHADGHYVWLEILANIIRDEKGEMIGSVMGSRDITERKRMEEHLRESEQLYRTLADSSPGIVFIVRRDTSLQYMNRSGLEHFGLTPEEIAGKKASDLFPPEVAKSLAGPISTVFQTGKPIHAENEVPFLGVVSWRDEDWVPLKTGSETTAVLGISRDITERKRAGDVLRESEERFRRITENMLDMVAQTDLQGICVYASSSWKTVLGYDPKSLLGRSLFELVHPNDLDSTLEIVLKALATHSTATFDYRYKHADGHYVWLQSVGNPLYDETDQISGTVLTTRDITDRKRLEEELRQQSLHLEELVAQRTGELQESEEKYRELFEACPVSLWEEDFSAVKQYLDELQKKGILDFAAYFANHPEDIAKCSALVKVLNVNKATLNLYNAKSVDEILGGLSSVLTEESNRKQFSGELNALAQGKRYYEAEMENRTLGGETKHCDVVCAVVPGYEESLAKVLICIVDLTPQKKLEVELVKSQRLAAIGETAAKVGHDLRNPLQGIAGALYLLKQESLTAEERNEMLQLIEKSVNYSDAIIKDLSEYSAEIKLNLAEATPKSISRDAIGAVKVPQNVTVQDFSEDQPTLRVDLDRMRRVFINLIQNGIDAMPQGGTLTVSGKKSGGNIEIALSDTGSGMPEKVMENLWKPFQTTKAKGMGLGLAICKRVVDAHGGSMSVKSEVGKGTTFTMQLPLRPVEVNEK
jgi:PAS domain S-box-containing protein